MNPAAQLVTQMLEDEAESPKEFLRRKGLLNELSAKLGEFGFVPTNKWHRFKNEKHWNKHVDLWDGNFAEILFMKGRKGPYGVAVYIFNAHMHSLYGSSTNVLREKDAIELARAMGDTVPSLIGDYYENMDGYREALAFSWHHKLSRMGWAS